MPGTITENCKSPLRLIDEALDKIPPPVFFDDEFDSMAEEAARYVNNADETAVADKRFHKQTTACPMSKQALQYFTQAVAPFSMDDAQRGDEYLLQQSSGALHMHDNDPGRL